MRSSTPPPLTMVQQCLALGFVPEENVTTFPGLTQVHLAEPPPLNGLCLAASRHHPLSPAAQAQRRTLLAAS